MNTIFLSVVIPSYNEMVNLQKGVLEKVRNYLSKQKYSYEVLIVDDGSDDGSDEFVKSFSHEYSEFHLIRNNHTGKAGAVTKGMLEARGEYILFSDMDQATPIEEVEKLLPYITDNYEVVIGSRNNARKGSPWTRILMSRSMMILRTIIVGFKGITDTQCGFKMFRHNTAKKLFKRLSEIHDGYKPVKGSHVTAGFDIELLYIAQKMGYAIKEVPVRWLYVETRRVSPVKDSIEGVLDLIRIRKRALDHLYD